MLYKYLYDKTHPVQMFARKILSGKIGRIIIDFLRSFKTFNQNYVVVGWRNTFMIFRKASKDKLEKIEITPKNILSLVFDYHQLNIKQYTAEISKHDYESKMLFINVWDNKKMDTLIRQFELRLSEETNLSLKELLAVRVFKHKYGNNYKYFISVWLDHRIKKARSNDRRFSEVTLLYTLQSLSKDKELRLKSKFAFSKAEAMIFCAKTHYWPNYGGAMDK